jgi:hypothetical protein
MMNEKGTLQLIAEHLVLAITPLKNAVSDLDSFRAFYLRLGWNVESLPSEYSNLATAVDAAIGAVDALTDEPELNEILVLFDRVRDLHTEIKGLSTTPAGVDPGEFLAEIGERLLEILITDYLAVAFPAFYQTFGILGVIELEEHEATATRPPFLRTRLKYAEIPRILSDPKTIPERVYGWGSNDFDFSLVADHLVELFAALNFRAVIDRIDPALRDGYQPVPEDTDKDISLILKVPFMDGAIAGVPVEAGLALLEFPAEGTSPPGMILQPYIPDLIGLSFPLGDDFTLRVRAGSDITSTFGIIIRPDEISVRYPFQPGTELPSAGFGVGIDFNPENSVILLGSPNETRIQLQGFSAGFELNYIGGELAFILGVDLKGLVVTVLSTKY